jgi:hypothetical protein
MINTRRLLGLVLAALLTATLMSLPSGATAVPATSASSVLAAQRDPADDFPRMPRRCVNPENLIPQYPGKCNLNDFRKGRPTIVLWGDSHAWQMIPALRKASRKRGVNLVAFVMGSCPVMDNQLSAQERNDAPLCLRSNDLALRYVANLKSHHRKVRVLLATYWWRYLQAIRAGDTKSYTGEMAARFKTAGPRLFRTLGRMHVNVDVNGQVVTVPPNHASCPKGNTPYACDLSRKRALRNEASTRRYVKRHMRALSGKPGYIDANRMCDATTCYARTPEGIYTFWDDQHISASMSRHLSYVLNRTVTRAGGKKLPAPPPDDGGDGGGCPLIILCP